MNRHSYAGVWSCPGPFPLFTSKARRAKRAVSIILESVSPGPSRRQRQHWIEAIERLNGRFLVYAVNGSMLGRLRYSPITSAALSSKSGSLLAMYRSGRCGCNLDCARIRCTLAWLRLRSAASLGQDQCAMAARIVIDTIGKKVVLILGRFTARRKGHPGCDSG